MTPDTPYLANISRWHYVFRLSFLGQRQSIFMATDQRRKWQGPLRKPSTIKPFSRTTGTHYKIVIPFVIKLYLPSNLQDEKPHFHFENPLSPCCPWLSLPSTSSTSHTCSAFIASSASRSASSYGENWLLEKDIPFGKASMIIAFPSATFNFDNVSC